MDYWRNLLLVRIRLSTYFWICFVLFLGLSYLIPGYKFDSGALTLFSVNSFLYGFYISPILSAQKSRIDSLHQIIRAEANALFSLMLKIKKLPQAPRTELQAVVTLYVHHKLNKRTATAGEKDYEELITYCLQSKYADDLGSVLDAVVANQKNRTDFTMQMGNKVYSNEWHVMMILFSITLGFVLTLSVDNNWLLHIVRALLCTGLTMLVIILIKLSTLTHKRAKQMWQPLQKLIDTHFYQID